MNFDWYKPAVELSQACEGMLRCIQTQLREDETLSEGAKQFHPAALLESALASGSIAEMLRAGNEGRAWIMNNASEDDTWEWTIGMPHPDIDRFEVAESHFDPEGNLKPEDPATTPPAHAESEPDPGDELPF